MPDPFENMDFSLILCTVGRTREVAEFLRSLPKNGVESFEIVLVDQNEDDRLTGIFAPYRGRFPVRHIRCERGLSQARNRGLAAAAGRIIAFPDDDCVYPAGLLEKVKLYFSEHAECGGLSTLVTDAAGEFSAGGYMSKQAQTITRNNVWRCGVSPSIFVRRESIGKITFDETLGVGSGTIFGSGEETDFLLNLLENGVRLDYRPELLVLHPRFRGPWRMERGWRYGCGMGRVLRKHAYGAATAVRYALLQAVRAAQAFFLLRFGRMMFHLAMSFGRLRGYLTKRQ